MTVNVEKGAVYMGGVDHAAETIQYILTHHITEVIDEAEKEGKINSKRADRLRTACSNVGDSILDSALKLHTRLTSEAKAADIDVPPPTVGIDEFIEVMKTLVSKRSGGGR